MIISNQVHCHDCDDKPFSGHRHDFRACKCGQICVDGGTDYLRRVSKGNNWTDISIEVSNEGIKTCLDALKWCEETGRNELGIVCAILRALRDSGSATFNR